MEPLPTTTVIIDKVTGKELLSEEDMTFSLPEHSEIGTLEGTTITIADQEYTIVAVNTEPKFNDSSDMTSVYVFLRVEKKP